MTHQGIGPELTRHPRFVGCVSGSATERELFRNHLVRLGQSEGHPRSVDSSSSLR